MTWLSTKRARATSSMAESGQALVEAALVLPLMLMLVLGVVAVGIVGHTDAALLAVAQEAARAAATASDPGAAATHGVARGMQVADGYSLQGTIVTVDARDFRPGRAGARRFKGKRIPCGDSDFRHHGNYPAPPTCRAR